MTRDQMTSYTNSHNLEAILQDMVARARDGYFSLDVPVDRLSDATKSTFIKNGYQVVDRWHSLSYGQDTYAGITISWYVRQTPEDQQPIEKLLAPA